MGYCAYIKQKETNNQREDIIRYNLSDSEEEILNAPASDTIFVDSAGESGFEQSKAELQRRYPLTNPDVEKYPSLYEMHIRSNYQYSMVTINLNPRLNISLATYKYGYYLAGQEFIDLVSYIKDHKKISYNFRINIENKKRLNKNGIYVRPVKKILEYNPEAARKQIKTTKKTHTKIKNNVGYHDLQAAIYGLQRILMNNIRLEIKHYDYIGKTKNNICKDIVFHADLCNIFLKEGIYRKEISFNVIKKQWKKLKRDQKMKYPKVFRSFMNKEIKIKLSEKPVQPYQIKAKQKANVFKLSNYKSGKYYC